MDIVYTFLIIGALIWLFWINQSKRVSLDIDDTPEQVIRMLLSENNLNISENQALKIIAKFESMIAKNNSFDCELPNNKQKYIYLNLMKNWYNELSAQNRYNEELSNKLRKDFIIYILFVKALNVDNFLASEEDYRISEQIKKEGDDPYDDKSKELYEKNIYLDDIRQYSSRIITIEDAFALAINRNEYDRLIKIREMDLWRFDSTGKNIAPDGYVYNIDDKLSKS